MSNHLIKELEREVDNLRSALFFQVSVRDKVVDWLEVEVSDNQDVVDAKDNHEEEIKNYEKLLEEEKLEEVA